MADEDHWLKKNASTLVALLMIFGLALFLRTFFVYGVTVPDRLYTGGSDSFYWDRIIRYGYETGDQITTDCQLNYPSCLVNPRPPMFAWFSLLSGWLISPAFATPWDAITYSLIMSTALFGALTVFPTYALVKEAFNRRAGLVAAFLLAVSPGHLQRSMASDADHDALILFFVVTGYFFFLRALKSINEKRWVESWRRPAAVRSGLGLFFRENRTAVLYSLLAGMSLTTVALTWQGWAYAPIILLVYFAFELFFLRIRNRDTLGITVVFGITMGTALLLAAPWYVWMGQVKTWFDVPAYLIGAAIVLAILFTVTRDYPWALVLPTVLGASSIVLGVGMLVNPALANAFVSGAGYFVQTKLYETIAEAQAPPLSQIILSFGWGTYFLGWGALGYLLWLFVSGKRTQTAYLFFVVWTLAAIVMAQSAARFIFNASPAFAAVAGYAIATVIERLDFDGLKRTYLSVAASGRIAAIKKSVKPRHVIGSLILVFLLLLPNVWYAADAAIPYDTKRQYDRQIYDLTPSFLRPANYESVTGQSGTFYLGAFGFSVPQPKQYYPAAWSWFRTQDTDQAPGDRPAFLSWWDYGFEAVDLGEHPTVADNFQDGYQLAGNAISAQSENEAIALLSLRLMEGDFHAHGRSFGPGVRAALTGFGVDATSLEIAFRDPAGLVPVVLGDPVKYGHYDPRMAPTNALYIYAGDVLTSKLSTDGQANLYRAVREATGKSIRYFAVDSRLFPSSASNTGIFYAPIKLSDHRIAEARDGRVIPTDFFRIFVTVRGNKVPVEQLSPYDQPDSTTGTIEYQPMFYHSFFYRVYAGFEPKEVGSTNDGIPALSGQNAQALQPLPAWNLSHWRIAYRTAYYNPYNDTANHTEAWRAINYFDGVTLQQDIRAGRKSGQVDLSAATPYLQGVVFAKYYDGAFVNGTVTLGGRAPVPGVRVTVTDELNVPHYVATTDAQGRYSVLVPFGDVTITFTTGTVDKRTLLGASTLRAVSLTVSDAAAMRENVDADGDGTWDWLMTRDVVLPAHALSGRVYQDVSGNGQFDVGQDLPLPGATVLLQNPQLGLRNTTLVGPDGRYAFNDVYSGTTTFNVTLAGRTVAVASQDVPTADASRDLVVPALTLAGRVTDPGGTGVAGATVSIHDKTNGTTIAVTANETGSFGARALLSGPVEVSASAPDMTSLPILLNLTGLGAKDVNVTAFPSGTLSGTAYVGGNVRPFATAEFTRTSGTPNARLVTADASGRFSVALPAGRWSVTGRHYRDGVLFAVLDTVDVARGSAAARDLHFDLAASVRGTVYSETLVNVTRGATVRFRAATGDVYSVRSSNQGTYLAYVPFGLYDVQATLGAAAYQDRRRFDASTSLDLPLALRTLYSGFVYRDLNRDGAREPEEGVAGATVAFTDPAGRVLTYLTPVNGSFAAALDPSKAYRMDVTAPGFGPFATGAASVADLRSRASIPLVASNVTLSGTLRTGGAPLTGTLIAVLFLAVGGGGETADAPVDGQGRYAALLAPGSYQIIVDANVTPGSDAVRWQNEGQDSVTLDLAAGAAARDVSVLRRARVTGTVTFAGSPIPGSSVTFEGADHAVVDTDALGRFDIYLAFGAYTVYANRTQGPDVFLFAGPVAVAGPVDVPVPLARAAEVGGQVLVAGVLYTQPLTITFTRAQSGVFRALSGPSSAYRVSLPEGDYTATVDEHTTMTFSGVQRYIRITFTGAFTIPAGGTALNFDVTAARAFDNATVSGRVTIDGAGSAATLRFTERAVGAMNATATSAPDGSYSVPLHPGSYNVHVVASGAVRAFLGTLVVVQGRDATLDAALGPAFGVQGVTTYKSGVRVATDVTFTAEASAHVRSDASGAYRIVLPPTSYAVMARTTETVNGVTVVYTDVASLDLTGPPDPLNLALERSPHRAVALAWDGQERTSLPAGGTVTYTIVLTNMGNIEDEYSLSGTPITWTFTFSPARPRLGFGSAGNSTAVSVTIRSPADALVDHGPVTITATSAAESSITGSVNVQVDVLRHRALSLALSSATPSYDGRFLNYTLTVSNRGNGREDVALVIPGLAELQARGWIARFAPPAGGDRLPEIRNLSVDGNATRSVTLAVENRGGGSGARIGVKAFAEDLTSLESAVQIRLDLPALSVDGRITASGLDLVSTLDLPYTLLAILITILACVTAGVVLTVRRRR